MNQYVTPQDFNRARAAQSAALGILGRPIVLANESLLKRIPADVIHTLMADLHLRIRKVNNRVVVIPADGRDWVLKSDVQGVQLHSIVIWHAVHLQLHLTASSVY